MKKKILISTILLFTISIFLYFFNEKEKTHIILKNGNDLLSAYYIKPKKEKIKGVVIFVHGDGEIPYDAYGYYDFIWEKFLDSGYAIFSWDKAGVEDSTGDWLKQSMQDRANEVLKAISFLKEKYNFKSGQIGLMGFSQAGWVIPKVAKKNKDVGFIIGVGFAIDWLEQSWYMTKLRLEKENASQKKIKTYLKKHKEEAIFWSKNPSYKKYNSLYAKYNGKLSKRRFEFVKKNALSNSKKDFEKIQQPTIIFLGEKDKNVNTKNTKDVLTNLGKANIQIKMIPNATHGLLKYKDFNQNKNIWFLIKLLFKGEKAFAKPFLSDLAKWLDELD